MSPADFEGRPPAKRIALEEVASRGPTEVPAVGGQALGHDVLSLLPDEACSMALPDVEDLISENPPRTTTPSGHRVCFRSSIIR